MPTAPNTPLERMRSRTHAALSHGDAMHQAYELLSVLGDAVADCEDAEPTRLGSMTLAEARASYEAVAYEEAVSIALEGLEVIYGESLLPDAVAPSQPATLSPTTLELCQRALETRLADVEAELAQAQNHRHFFRPFGGETMPVGDALEALQAEESLVAEALDELAAARAATPGTAAC